MYGGLFYFQVESTSYNTLSEILLREIPENYVKGNILVFKESDNEVIRDITLEGSMFLVAEDMQVYSSIPMVTTFAISPNRIDINERLHLDRRCPQTSGIGWHIYKAEEVKYAKATAEPDINITDAYWIDEDGKERRDLNVDFLITLYIVVDEGVPGKSVNLLLDDDDNENIVATSVSGTINNDGIIVVDDFKFNVKK